MFFVVQLAGCQRLGGPRTERELERLKLKVEAFALPVYLTTVRNRPLESSNQSRELEKFRYSREDMHMVWHRE